MAKEPYKKAQIPDYKEPTSKKVFEDIETKDELSTLVNNYTIKRMFK